VTEMGGGGLEAAGGFGELAMADAGERETTAAAP
jgi:hypothetical protein